MTDDVLPKSTKRKLESRRKLLAAARQLFVERGYHDTRPQDIAKLAGVGHGTFYLHFPDKRACYFAFVDEASMELDEVIGRWQAGKHDMGERVEATLMAIFEYHSNNPGVMPAAFCNPGVIAAGTDHTVAILDSWAKQWADSLKLGVEQGAIRNDYDHDIIGSALVGMVHYVTSCSPVKPEDCPRVVSNLKRLIVSAMATTQAAAPVSAPQSEGVTPA